MNRFSRNMQLALAILLMGGAGSVCLARGAEPSKKAQAKKTAGSPEQVTVVVQASDKDKGTGKTREMVVHVTAVQPGEYWIGVACSSLDDPLVAAQLGITKGLVVDQVVPKSPAEQAGLQRLDILVRAGNQALSGIEQLVASLEKAKATPIKLTIYRQGKQKTVQITPAKRPKKMVVEVPDKETATEWRKLEEALNRLGVARPHIGLDQSGKGNQFSFVMPGMIFPDDDQALPKDLEVTITRKGKQPARIAVKRGDKQWDVDEQSLDKLPEDIRKYVEQMLGKPGDFAWSGTPAKLLEGSESLRARIRVVPGQPLKLRPLQLKIPEGFPKALRSRVRTQLDRVEKQLDQSAKKLPAEVLQQIQSELHQLRKQLEQLENTGTPERD